MNETTITAQPGTPFIEVVREFDAPRSGCSGRGPTLIWCRSGSARAA